MATTEGPEFTLDHKDIGDLLDNGGMLGGLKTLEKAAQPYVQSGAEYLQKHLGKPIVDSYLKARSNLPWAEEPGGAVDTLGRASLSWMTGEEPDTTKLMKDHPTVGGPALTAAHLVGGAIPYSLQPEVAGLEAGNLASKVAPVVGEKLAPWLGHAASGAIKNVPIGAGSRYIEGQDPADPKGILGDLGLGAGLGVGFHAAGTVGSAALDKIRSWLGKPTANVGPEMNSHGPVPDHVPVDLKDIKPSGVQVYVAPDGTPTARVTEIRTDGPSKVADHPIESLDDATKIGELARKHGVVVGEAPEHAGTLAALPSEHVDALTRPGEAPKGKIPMPETDAPATPSQTQAVVEDGHVKLTEPAAAPEEPGPAAAAATAEAPTVPPEVPGIIGPEQPPGWVKDELDDVMKHVSVFNKLRMPKFLEQFQGGIFNDMHRGPKEFRNWIMRQQAAKSLQSSVGEHLKQHTEALGEIRNGADYDLEKVGLGKMSMDDLAAKNPQVSREAQELFRGTFNEIQSNSQLLAGMGMIDPAKQLLRDKGLMDRYMATLYARNYFQGNKWSKLVQETKPELIQDAVQYLHRQNPDFSKERVAHEVLEILEAENPLERWGKSQLSGTESAGPAKNRLKAKDDLPAVIRNLIGEEHSAAVRVSVTLAHQRALVEQGKIWFEVRKSPYWSPEPDAAHSLQIPNDPKQYGLAAGGFVPQEMLPLVQSGPKTAKQGLTMLNAIGGLWKTNMTVGNPLSWTNNIMRNIYGSVLSGALDVASPGRTGRAVLGAFKVLKAMEKDPSGRSSPESALGLEMKKFGALAAGQAETEMSLNPAAVALEKAMKQGDNHSVWDVLSAVRDHMDNSKVGPGGVKHVYDLIDKVFKAAGYIASKERALKQGMNPQQAAEYAARIVNLSYPNFEHVGRVTDKLRKSPIGYMAPFLSGTLEDWRVISQTPKRLMSEPDLKWRMASFGSLMGAMAAGATALARSNGITPEDEEAAKAAYSPYAKQYRQVLVPLPWHGPKGAITLMDLTQWMPWEQLKQGNQDDSLVGRIASNALLQFVQGGSLEQPLRSKMERTGLVSPMQSFNDQLLPGEAGTWKGVSKMIMEEGLLPRGVASIGKAARRTGMLPENDWPGTLGRHEEPLSIPQAAASLALPLAGNVRLDKDSPTLAARDAQAQVQRRELDKKRRLADGEGYQSTPKTRERVLDAIEEEKNKVNTLKQSIDDAVEKARLSHRTRVKR